MKGGYNISNIYCYVCNFIGCQRRESTKEEVYKEFQRRIVTMSSYKCIAEIEASEIKVLIIMYLFIVTLNRIIIN